MKKEITIERVNKVIMKVLLSHNKSAERAILWKKLNDLRASLIQSTL